MWKFEKYLFAAMVTVCFVAMPIEATAADESADKAASALPIQLGAPFRDGAVLQRGMEVPVWGWSKPGTSVTVAFAGQSNLAVAGKDGKWVAKLDAMKASFDPREMVISEQGGKHVTLTNILVGEVWLASGQSNMRWTVNERHGTSCMQLKTEPRNGVAPIREFTVTNCYAQLLQGICFLREAPERANGSTGGGEMGVGKVVAKSGDELGGERDGGIILKEKAEAFAELDDKAGAELAR